MVVMCSVSVCALAHGREKSAGTGAGCQCPCHPVGWWLATEGLHFLPLSATVCRHGRGWRLLQGSPHHSVLRHVYSHLRGKASAWLPPVAPLLLQATAVAGDAPHERGGSFAWLVRQVLLPKSPKEI